MDRFGPTAWRGFSKRFKKRHNWLYHWHGHDLVKASSKAWCSTAEPVSDEQNMSDDFSSQAVWPDVGIESCPHKSNHSHFYLKVIFLKKPQKLPNILNTFWKEICCQELKKTTQSGHTAAKACQMCFRHIMMYRKTVTSKNTLNCMLHCIF